jgi:hypothetical protein
VRDDARGAAAVRPPDEHEGDAMRRGYARARERNDALRASLRPLGPGERPLALRLAALLAAVLCVANLVLVATGAEIGGHRQVVAGLLFAAIMGAAAAGLWQRRYWAALGFEALLGCLLLWSALSLLVASNLAAALLCLAVFAVAGPLFWFLIRVMARIQAGRRTAPPGDVY